MQGVSGTSSKSSKAGFSNPIQAPDTQNSANTGNTFNLRAKALAVREGFDTFQREKPQQQGQNQLDPAILARIALEEELKKRGGGGGGGFRKYNPMLWVPYSFKLMTEAMMKLYQLINKTLDQGLGNINASFKAANARTLNLVNNFITRPILVPLSNAMASFARSVNRGMMAFIRNPISTTMKLFTNIMQMGMVIASAIANGLKKFFNKEEDRMDPDQAIYESEESLFSRFFGIFTLGDRDNESNGKSVKSHIDNMSKFLTGWLIPFKRRKNRTGS